MFWWAGRRPAHQFRLTGRVSDVSGFAHLARTLGLFIPSASRANTSDLQIRCGRPSFVFEKSSHLTAVCGRLDELLARKVPKRPSVRVRRNATILTPEQRHAAAGDGQPFARPSRRSACVAAVGGHRNTSSTVVLARVRAARIGGLRLPPARRSHVELPSFHSESVSSFIGFAGPCVFHSLRLRSRNNSMYEYNGRVWSQLKQVARECWGVPDGHHDLIRRRHLTAGHEGN